MQRVRYLRVRVRVRVRVGISESDQSQDGPTADGRVPSAVRHAHAQVSRPAPLALPASVWPLSHTASITHRSCLARFRPPTRLSAATMVAQASPQSASKCLSRRAQLVRTALMPRPEAHGTQTGSVPSKFGATTTTGPRSDAVHPGGQWRVFAVERRRADTMGGGRRRGTACSQACWERRKHQVLLHQLRDRAGR
jgi:hypothetical protein